MKFMAVRGRLVNGEIKVELDRPRKCQIALAEFFIPSIVDKSGYENNIDVFCDQIDSSFDNPNRLLKRLIFNHSRLHKFYNSFEAKWFDFKLLDSQDKFLTLRIRRTNGQVIKGDDEIFLTLVFNKDEDKWFRI